MSNEANLPEEDELEQAIEEQPAKRRRGRPKRDRNYFAQRQTEAVTPEQNDAPEVEATKAVGTQMMINIGKRITGDDGYVYHIKRKWVPLTPVICQVRDCGYDLLEQWRKEGKDIPPWDELTQQEQALALKHFARHAAIHRNEQAQVLSVKEQEAVSWPPPPAAGNRIPK